MKRSSAMSLATTLLAAGGLAAAGCAGSEPPPPRTVDVTDETGPTITRTTLLPGDVVVDHGIGAAVPDPGQSVQAIFDLVDGGAQTLRIETAADGAVTISRESPEVAAEASPDACHSPVACNDPAFLLGGKHWAIQFKWFFQASSTPAANSKDNVETRLRAAVHNTSTGHNGCGISPHLSSSAQYQGRTTVAPNLTPSQCSTHSDGRSVVGFGPMPARLLAGTCVWGPGNQIVEADTLINSSLQWYATEDPPGGCSNSFGIEPVMTHEFGHSFGLLDLNECQHGRLTMGKQIDPCDNSSSTLGLGDIKGMQAMY